MGCGCGKSKFSKTNGGVARRAPAPVVPSVAPSKSVGNVVRSAEMRNGAVTTSVPLKRTTA